MSEAFRPARWPAPSRVHCLVTTRHGGVSLGDFASLNLGLHVGDESDRVLRNRQRLQQHIGEDIVLHWVHQVHGNQVHVVHDPAHSGEADVIEPRADALYTRQPRQALGVLTADCLPVCFSSRDGTEVAVAHAGWRGLAAGVLENTLDCFEAAPVDILAWLGPSIAACHFEVGEEVKQTFLAAAPALDAASLAAAFQPAPWHGKWMADLPALARLRVQARGVQDIQGAALCTYCDREHFYSYRRQPRTGRFATVIYRD